MSTEFTTSSSLDTTFANRFRGSRVQYDHGVASAGDFRLSDENPEGAFSIEDGATKRFKAAGGQVLTATLFNEGKRNLTLIHPGWLGDGEHALSKLQANLLAEQDPDTTFAFINMPGMRGSEALPTSVMKEMKRSGSFESYGEEIAAAFDALLKDFEQTKGIGWSTGARAMIGVLAARHNEAGLEKIVAIDSPGSRELGLAGIINAFIIQEGGYAKLYSPDQQTIAAKQIGAPKSPLNAIAMKQALYDFPVAMSRAGLEEDLLKATNGLDASRSISIVSPETSALNMPTDVAEIMKRVSLNTDARLIHYIIAQQSHTGIIDQNAPLFARLGSDLFNN